MAAGLAAAALTAAQVLILVNDNSAESRSIGEYYARHRGVPTGQVCRLRAPLDETISRPEYDARIAAPVARCLRDRALVDQVLFLVTTSGVPLKIRGSDGFGGDQAAVDSELALLYQDIKTGKSHRAAGLIPKPPEPARVEYRGPVIPKAK